LARMPEESAYGIFEIGTNHPGEIGPLSELASPDVALLLNVLPAHIGNFGSLSEIRQEKLEIVAGLAESGTLVVPAELDLRGLSHEKILSFGLDSSNGQPDAFGKVRFAAGKTVVDAIIVGHKITYQLNVGGEHRVLTSLAVLALLYSLGADLERAAADFSSLSTPAGRGNEFDVAGIKVIDDSYNANPVSMAYAIDALKKDQGGGRQFALLGEMLELGELSEQAHADIIVATRDINVVMTVGEGFANTAAENTDFVSHKNSVADIDIQALANSIQPGDSILIKGSNKVFWAAGFVSKLLEQISKNAATSDKK